MNTAAKARPAAVIYTHSLLEGSMTFIKGQAESLQTYVPIYAGSHRAPGIALPPERTFTANDGSRLGLVREAMFRKLAWAPSLVRQLGRFHPRVVHAHFGTCGPAAMTLADALGTPLIVTFHGQDATMADGEARKSHRGRELLARKSALIERTGCFIAVSNYIRERLYAQGYPEQKVRVLRNGIDLEFFNPSERELRTPTIVFVGRLVEKKGVEYLLQAAERIRDAGVAFELVVIGSGPLEPALKKAAANARLPCRFTGFISPEEIRPWLERACVVAVPSVTAANGDSEGLPTILLEAQAMMAPIVATRHSGIPEGVVPGETAELVEERDVEGLAIALRSFLENPEKSRAFGEAARQFVSERFDMRAQAAELEALYDELGGRVKAGMAHRAG